MQRGVLKGIGVAVMLAGIVAGWMGGQAEAAPPAADDFNYVVGTQTFSPAYHFTVEDPLLETARAIRRMGSRTIKFRLEEKPQGEGKRSAGRYKSLAEVADQDPATRQILAMDFKDVLMWAYPLANRWVGHFEAKWGKAQDEAEYREIYDLTQYLLRKFNGTGKRFYLGHWEGDWMLIGGKPDPRRDPSPERIQGMIHWLNVRQKAVEDARRDTPHKDVAVYHYTEVNLVQKAIQGKPTVTNDVLPRVNVDYVSYSSYDSLGGKDIRGDLKKALDFIESTLPKKGGITGRRVFIGEYGFPAINNTPAQQDTKSRQVMRAALEWGCPFCLYWEMYNNEVTPEGKQRGFWLIDDKGVKQPVYETHRKFYAAARQWVDDFKKKEGRAPTAAEFGKAGAELLLQ